MLELVLEALARAADPLKPWSATMTSESTIDDLIGPLDLTPIIEQSGGPYNHRRTVEGLLHADVVWLREGLSAPPRTLASVRDIMESKVFANGDQQVPSSVKAWLLDTNIEPRELMEMGDEFRALTERFPLQVSVNLSPSVQNLKSAYYSAQFERQLPHGPSMEEFRTMQAACKVVSVGEDSLSHAATLMANAAKAHGFVLNPRIFQKGVRLMQASATIHGRGHTTSEDLAALVFVPGGEVLEEELGTNIQRAQIHSAANKRLSDAASLYDEWRRLHREAKSGNFIAQSMLQTTLEHLKVKVAGLPRLPDEAVADRDRLLDRLREQMKLQSHTTQRLLQLKPEYADFVAKVDALY